MRIDGTERSAKAYRRVQARGGATHAVSVSEEVSAIVPAELPVHVREAFTQLLSETDGLRRALARARQRIEELEKLVDTDELTPVSNRRGLLRDLGRTLAEVERHGLTAALIFIDVDRLKQINDTFGHAAGDAALVHVAEALAANLRESDTIARLGGDEFAVILLRVNEAQARMKTQQIVSAVSARPVRLREQDMAVTVSAGFHLLRPGDTPKSSLSAADGAMYAMKMSRD